MTFTPTDTLLLTALLPTAANQQRLPELLSQNLDWSRVVQQSIISGTASLLRFNLVQATALGQVPQPEQERLAKESHSWVARQQIYAAETRQLIAAFAAAGIPSLPLKGAALMLGKYYPLPGLRAAGDVDLLVAPEQAEAAFAVALARGYEQVVIKKPVRVAIPLAYELRHLPVLRAPAGVLVELHYRAFHDPRYARDFAWAEMFPRAVTRQGVQLPAPEDVALHLIQHTMVDLTSANGILRTLADLHFLFAAEPEAKARLLLRAEEFALRNAAALALEALQTLEANALATASPPVRLLLETALRGTEAGFFEAARLLEYLDLRQQPLARLRHLYALLRASGAPATVTATPAAHPFRRFSSLWRRLQWKGVAWADVRRVLALRRITQGK